MILETMFTSVALKIIFSNGLQRRQQRCSCWVSWGLPLISPSLAGLARICAAVRQEVHALEVYALEVHALEVHALEVHELKVQELEVQCWRSGQELEVQDMEVQKLKVQKLEVQEPELLGAEGVFRGVLRCSREVKKVWVTLPSLEVREREAFPFTPSSQWNHSLPSSQSLVQLPSWNARVTSW